MKFKAQRDINKKMAFGALAASIALAITCGAGAFAADEAKTTDKEGHKWSAAEEAWRSKPPVLPAPRAFKLPEVKTYKLDNGLKVQLSEDHRFPYVTAFIGMKSGSTLDNPVKLGVAELTADMITEGTEKLKSKQIAEESDFIGGSLAAYSDYDFTIANGSCLSNYTDRLFSLLSDVIRNPSFPEDELKLKKTNWLQELTMKRGEPDFLLEERFRKVVFGGHPYGVVAPKPEMIESITREDLKKFHAENFIPNDTILLVIGDFDGKKMEELIASSFGSWKPGTRKAQELPAVAQQKSRRIYLVDRPDSVQSSLMIGNLGIKKTDPDYFSTRVMNQILGGGSHSRLFLNIREQKGYTYGAYSSLGARVHPDTFSASADVRTEVTAPSLKEFIFELEKIRDSKVTSEELDDAKNYIVGQFQLALETQNGLASRLLEVSLFDLPENYLETYSENIMAIGVDDVQKAAQKVIQAKELVITVVGDAKKVKAGLEPFAPVEVYDVNGSLSNAVPAQPAGGSPQ